MNAPATAIWPWLVEPEKMKAWYEKLVSLSRSRTGPVQLGERYWTKHELKGRTKEVLVEVVELVEQQRLVLLYQMNETKRGGEVRETLELRPRGERIRVIRTIDIRRSGIPWIARLLIELIHRWGRPEGTPYLEILREIVEQGERDHPNT